MQHFCNTVSATCLQFAACSEDGHLLVMTTGDPENSIMVWKWSTGKVLVADTSSFSVHHISCNPWDGTQLIAIGKSELNHVDFVEEELKLKADTLLYHVGPQCNSEHTILMLCVMSQGTMWTILQLLSQKSLWPQYHMSTYCYMLGR